MPPRRNSAELSLSRDGTRSKCKSSREHISTNVAFIFPRRGFVSLLLIVILRLA
jgi:hypothetical protein